MTSNVCYVCSAEYACDCNSNHEKCKLREDINTLIIYDPDSDSTRLLYPIYTHPRIFICSKKCHFK